MSAGIAITVDPRLGDAALEPARTRGLLSDHRRGRARRRHPSRCAGRMGR